MRSPSPKSGSFNPRTRVGCDNIVTVSKGKINVSIHAPVWGATGMQHASIIAVHVSIHAPVWGATKLNPPLVAGVGVSIHAPVWGATLLSAWYDDSQSFNPRTRVGCDMRWINYLVVALVSIHAPVWGATGLRVLASDD